MVDISPDTRAVQLQMINYLLDFCRQNGIRLYAEGGTLLGAVRERGFIKYDEDVDFAMFRRDYDRFVSIAREKVRAPYFFQDGNTDVDYFGPICRIRLDNTTGVCFREMSVAKFHQGMFIDIFPLDEIDNSRLIWIFKWIRIVFWRRLLTLAYAPVRRSNPISTVIGIVSHRILRHLVSARRIYNELHNALRSSGRGNGDSFGLLCLNRSWRVNMRKKEWYHGVTMVEFEGLKIPCPSDSHSVLVATYGEDYMRPKLHDQAKCYFDCSIDYRRYIAEFQNEKRGRVVKL